jgi:hypothetical protein
MKIDASKSEGSTKGAIIGSWQRDGGLQGCILCLGDIISLPQGELI